MAVKSSDKPITPKSTGAVEMPTDPVTVEQTDDVTSTGAVQMPEVVEQRVEHYDDPVTVRVETPTEPVTMGVTWLDEAESKTIDAPAKPKASTSSAKVGTK